MLNVLVACEESQRVCLAFREIGANAFSCDLQKCSGGRPDFHFFGDCFPIIENRGGSLECGGTYFLPRGETWDILIAHPPCTYLSHAGVQFLSHPDDLDKPFDQRRPHPKFPHRREQREEAAEFFLKFTQTGIEHVCIENPFGYMSQRWRKPDQVIQPWQFGDSFQKRTCLWLIGLPPLEPTKIVDKGAFHVREKGKYKGHIDYKWYSICQPGMRLSAEERRKLRSKTFPGIAKAMAEQWTNYVNGKTTLFI